MFVHVLISFSSHCSLVESLASGHHCHKEIAFSYQQQKASESGVRESLISQWLGKEGGGGSEPGKLAEALFSWLFYCAVSILNKSTTEVPIKNHPEVVPAY